MARVFKSAKERIVYLLKTSGAATSGALAKKIGLTQVAVRQHLNNLQRQSLVIGREQSTGGRGRPAILWSLTNGAQSQFPERHRDLSVDLMEAVRNTFGDNGLAKIIDARAERQIEEYRNKLPPRTSPLPVILEALAGLRTEEGYMAGTMLDDDGEMLLVEHHCPIGEAAHNCTGLCAAELRVFQAVLGPDVTVERIKHLVSGDTKCVYRMTKKPAQESFD